MASEHGCGGYDCGASEHDRGASEHDCGAPERDCGTFRTLLWRLSQLFQGFHELPQLSEP